MIAIFLGLDPFHSLDYDAELIVRNNISAEWDGDCILASTEILGLNL